MRIVGVLSLVVTTAASAQVCSASALSDELQYLRRLTLDLAGRAPTVDELERVVNGGTVDAATLDSLLQPAMVKRQLRRLVRQQLQANLRLPLQNDGVLSRTGPNSQLPPSEALWVFNRAQRYRPRATGPALVQQPCFDEPATFDATGRPIATDHGDGYLREGWVMVHPYWEADARAQVKVCAFDAQATLTVQLNGQARSCGEARLAALRECGCGPELRFCQGNSRDEDPFTETVINEAMVEQALRLVDRIVDERRPWSDLLLIRELEVNGPLTHYLRYQTAMTTEFSSRENAGFALPNLAYTDRRWVRVPLTGRSSGLLTTPFYLLKFASNRARANQLFNAFLCSPLQAPATGLPSAADPCSREPNLSLRCGCSACHVALEPAAASWGRYVERGTWELEDAEFPTSDPSCISPDGGSAAVSPRCATHYRFVARSPSEAPFVGQLTWRVFLDAEGRANFDQGPARWANTVVNDGAFAACTVKTLWSSLVGRPFDVSLEDERAQLSSLTASFRSSNHDVLAVLRAIVTSPQYRQVERPVVGASR